MINMPFSSKKQFFYLLYNQPEVFMEWVEDYGVPKEFKVGSTEHWRRKVKQMDPKRSMTRMKKKMLRGAESFEAEERGWHKRTHPKNSKRFYYSKGNRPHYSAQRIKHGAYLDGPGTNLESANFDGKGFDNTKGRMIDLPKDIHEDFMENSHAPVLYSISDESHYGEFGAEGAIHEDTLTNKEIKTNVVYPLLLGILGGTIATVVGNLWSLEIAKKRGHI